MISDIDRRLIHNSVNEILNGLPATLRAKELLSRRKELERVFEEWSRRPSPTLIVEYKDLITACISIVLFELGEDEFETRVGVGTKVAEAFVRRISEGKGTARS